MTSRTIFPFLFLIALPAACSDTGSTSRLASETIDATGGTVLVETGDREGTSLEVPAGAVTSATTFVIDRTGVTVVPDGVAVGLASFFQPTGLTLAVAATVTLTFDPASVPQGAADSDFVIKQRDRNGRITDVEVTSLDRTAGRAVGDVTTLGSFWVVVLQNGGELDLFEYWPLGDGDRWEYDNDLAIMLSLSMTEPNFQGTTVGVLSLRGSGLDEGLYVDRIAEETLMIGRFSAFTSATYQEVHESSLLFLPATARLGDESMDDADYLGYEPLGNMVSTYSGMEEFDTKVISEGSLTVPAGTFNDVVEVEMQSERSDDRPETTSTSFRFWLARDVGPIQVEITGMNETAYLRAARVGGQTLP